MLPDPDKTKAYVNNLINSYNALVDSSDKYRPDFQSAKAYFALYHDVGYSFHVIIAQALPDILDITRGVQNATDFLDLEFIPIVGDQPNVTMDYNKTGIGLTGELNEERDVTIQVESTIIYHDFIFCIYKTDISGDYMVNSANAARLFYDGDENALQTHVFNTQATSQVQTNQNPQSSSFVNEMIVTVVGGIIAIVAGQWIYDYMKRKRARRQTKEAKEVKRTEKARRKLLRQNIQKVQQADTTEDKKSTQDKETRT